MIAIAVWIACLALLSCQRRSADEKPLGEAFVGPMSLNLREELAQRAGVTATVRHGERVEILATRRRFAKVRTPDGAVGWTDSRLLLDAGQMQRLRDLANTAAAMPSQGKATPFDLLNVHTEPNRQSPSFYQIREGELADVLAQRVMPRLPYAGEPLPARPSRIDAEGNPLPLDDWMLVRLNDGRAGWVLSRLMMMAIPDEVAQYAEGHYITSYFPLGEVQTESGAKKNWLWTTRSARLQDHDYDGFRVFVYSQRRKRYETAMIDRNVTGYYPTEVEHSNGLFRFRLICAGKDGILQRRTYEFNGQRVRLIERQAWQLPDADRLTDPVPQTPQLQPPPGLLERLWRRVGGESRAGTWGSGSGSLR